MKRGTVYMVRQGDFAKFGWTTGDPARRVGALQTGNPQPLKLRAVVETVQPTEHWIHRRLSEWHTSGEWFHFSPTQWQVIDRALTRGTSIGHLVDAIAAADLVHCESFGTA